MKIATALLASGALLVTTHAAAQVPKAATAYCQKDAKTPCVATVIVPAGCGSGIHVAPDPLFVETGAQITWKIVSSPGWSFVAIKIHDGDKAYAVKASGDTAVAGAKENAPKGMFKYDIILKSAESPSCKHDPTIINQ